MTCSSPAPGFLTHDFLLSNDTARRLYHDHAAAQPIYDYHCHLPPADLSGNRRFANLCEAWLEGDHYKWRAMRAAGIPESHCTGDADPYDKFLAFARTVPQTLRNPLYHWTHLELQRYFGIDLLLSESTAREVWDDANAKLAEMPVATILDRFNVALIGTTDDPADDLAHHQKLRDHPLGDTTVVPALRPDKVHQFHDLQAWNAYIDRLAAAAGKSCDTLDELLEVLRERHGFFHTLGSRISDHGLTHLPDATCSHKRAAKLFKKARGKGKDAWNPVDFDFDTPIRQHETDQLTAFLLQALAKLDHERGWTQQCHLGAMRNNNDWAFANLGPDTGFDSIGDFRQGPGLKRFLGTLAGDNTLPKTILYNLNPSDNYLFATMAANFNGAGDPDAVPGKMQFGSGWWFLDQKEGMTWQINALSNLGLLPRFVGMLTDSRSFLSYPRHEYFRRLLCELIGRDVEAGELPADFDLLGKLVEDISFHNAKHYFAIPLCGRYA